MLDGGSKLRQSVCGKPRDCRRKHRDACHGDVREITIRNGGKLKRSGLEIHEQHLRRLGDEAIDMGKRVGDMLLVARQP